MVFPGGGPEPRHPSQLYEAPLEGIVLFLVLRLLTHRSASCRKPGFVSGAFAAGYGVARTFAEFFREPDIQIGYLAGGLTMGMLLSIPMVFVGIGLMIWAARRKPAESAGGRDPARREDRRAIARHRADHRRRYMAPCLGDPEHGYYMTREPFGRGRRLRHRAGSQPDVRRTDRRSGPWRPGRRWARPRRSSSPSSAPAAAR